MDNDFYAVIVLYNMNLKDSITCQNILKIKNHRIHTIIVDNSTCKNNNKKLCEANNFVYLSMHGNKGLSKAYNKALDYLNDKRGIVIWLDDDSKITQQYFDELEDAADTHPDVDIFVPVIMGQDGKFWSPNRARFLKNKQLKIPEETIKDSEFNAINSCTASRLRIFKSYRYDERLFLDQVDHNFCREQRKMGRHFLKLDCVIHHNFSTKNKKSNYEKLLKRYSIMIPDYLMYCSFYGNKAYHYLGYIKVIGWGIRESYKCHNPTFLVWCCKQIKYWEKRHMN